MPVPTPRALGIGVQPLPQAGVFGAGLPLDCLSVGGSGFLLHLLKRTAVRKLQLITLPPYQNQHLPVIGLVIPGNSIVHAAYVRMFGAAEGIVELKMDHPKCVTFAVAASSYPVV